MITKTSMNDDRLITKGLTTNEEAKAITEQMRREYERANDTTITRNSK